MKEIILIPNETLSNKTNCGSQLVCMLEEFYRLSNCRDEYNGEFELVHQDLSQNNWISTEVYYYKQFIDWLHKKNKRTYHGLMIGYELFMLNNLQAPGIVNTVYWNLFDFKNKQSLKGIKVYG